MKALKKNFQNYFLLKLFFFRTFFLRKVIHRKSKPVTMFWKTTVNKDFSKLQWRNLARIKGWNPFQDYRHLPKNVGTVVFKSKYGLEITKTLNTEADVLRYYVKYCPSKIKLQGKTSIVEVSFIKVVGQKPDTVINMNFVLNVSWNSWKGWRYEVRGNSKIKAYGLYLWLTFPDELWWKIKHKVPYRGKFCLRKVIKFSWNFVTFTRGYFSRRKLSLMETFPNKNLFLYDTDFKVKMQAEEQTSF